MSSSIGAHVAHRVRADRRSELDRLGGGWLMLAVALFPLFKPTYLFTLVAAATLTARTIEQLISGRW